MLRAAVGGLAPPLLRVCLFASLQEIGILPRHIEANLYVPKLFAQAAFKKERRPSAAPLKPGRATRCAVPAPSPLGYWRTRQRLRFCGARREPAAGRARAAAEQQAGCSRGPR